MWSSIREGSRAAGHTRDALDQGQLDRGEGPLDGEEGPREGEAAALPVEDEESSEAAPSTSRPSTMAGTLWRPWVDGGGGGAVGKGGFWGWGLTVGDK